ncbi:hypothetical protein B0H10DRAFT_1178182 [Mycena sp. CBHHK59/15]|nr:hypothetical protein B0H10DRAFT_1178182 [Mycena sp. CBHHK59/15]
MTSPFLLPLPSLLFNLTVIFGSALPSPLYTPTTANLNAITLSHSEIIPQALSVRNVLAISAACTPVVLALMYLFAPLAWPIVKLLDWAQRGRPRTHVSIRRRSCGVSWREC